MQMQSVDSSNLAAIGYDPETKVMRVEFLPPKGYKTGSLYQYQNVEQATFDAFRDAESKGKFLAREIKGKFTYAQIRPPTPKEDKEVSAEDKSIP